MKRNLGVVAFIFGCAACCAPLLVPLLAGSGLATLAAALTFDGVACAAAGLLLVGAFAYWLVKRRRTSARGDCGCEGGGAVGGACATERQPSV